MAAAATGADHERHGVLWVRLRSVLPGLIGLSLVATFMAWRGRTGLAAVLVSVAVVLAVSGLLTPKVGRALERVVEWVGHWVGRVLTVVLLGLLWLVAVVPVSLLNRVLGIDLLVPGSAKVGWHDHEPGAVDRRQYGREPRERGHIGRRLARVAVVLVVLAAVAVPVYHRFVLAGGSRSDFTAFAPRATSPVGGADVATDEWAVTAEGVRVSEQTFPGEPWGADVIEEQTDLLQTGDDRYGLVNVDRQGRYVNVVDGHRATYEVDDPDLTVWLFGGSTAYGLGQRDEHTIASNLVREAEADGHRIEVVNFGVSGYANVQEAQVFEDRLAAGERPDVAVFLDGVNDLAVAFERERYGLFDTSEPETIAFSEELQAERAQDAHDRGYTESHDPERQARLAAEQYGQTAARARALGEQYDVPTLLFWQPHVQTMEAGAPGLATVLNNLQFPEDFLPTSNRIADEAAAQSGVEPVDLTDIFDDADQPIFFDWSHTNEAGARIEGAALYEHLRPLLEQAADG